MSRRNGFGGREQGASRRFPRTQRCFPISKALVEPTTRGDPESPLRWTCKSVRRLTQALQAQGHEVSRTLVGHLLNEAGYSLQGNRKTTEGDSHPDRDAQFGYINTQVTTALAEQQPVISVDTKKKELVGDFRNNGREYRPQGSNVPGSTASGITPSHQVRIAQIARLSRDGPLVMGRRTGPISGQTISAPAPIAGGCAPHRRVSRSAGISRRSAPGGKNAMRPARDRGRISSARGRRRHQRFSGAQGDLRPTPSVPSRARGSALAITFARDARDSQTVR